MAKWEDLPGELHADIWGHFRNNIITSLRHVDRKPFENFLAECTAERTKENAESDKRKSTDIKYESYFKARTAERTSDRLALEHAVLISKRLAWTFSDQLEIRLNATIEHARVFNDKLWRMPWYTGHARRDDPEREAYSMWHSRIDDRMRRMERVISRVQSYQVFDACWLNLPLKITAKILVHAMRNYTVGEDVWDEIEDGKYGFDLRADTAGEAKADLRKRIFRLSMVSKSVAGPVANALVDVILHLEEQRQLQRLRVSYADGELRGWQYDSDGWKGAALACAEAWLDDLTTLRNYADKMYFVVSCWNAGRGTRKIRRRLKLQIVRECLQVPKLSVLKQIINSRELALGREGENYNHLLDDDSTCRAFEDCRKGFQKMSLFARCSPTAWVVKVLRKYSARLQKLSDQIDEMLSWGHYDWKVANLDWKGQNEALRDDVEALLNKVYTWAAESWSERPKVVCD